MYEMSIAECQRRRRSIGEIRKGLESEKDTDFTCICHNRAQESQPQLLERFIAGDDQVVESILALYQGCIDSWAKDIYKDPVYESHFKAEIAARLIRECEHIESATLCHQLKQIACDVADAHLKHIEEHHLSRQNSDEYSMQTAATK